MEIVHFQKSCKYPFLYLYCGWGSNSLHGEWMKRCLTSRFLCGNLQNNFSPHKAPRHTSHIWIPWFASRPSLNNATTPLLGITARPELIVTCVQSYDVGRSWGWSPYRHGWSWLMPRPCQHLSDKGETKISVWNFLPTTWR